MIQNSVVAYIPALHRGYIDFFRKYRGVLYILSADFVKEIPRMERDIRALKPEEVKQAIGALGIFSEIIILEKNNLEKLINSDLPIIMPDEDVSRRFAEQYLSGKPVIFVPVFLRWDKQISTKEFEIPPDRVISETEFDKEIMKSASEEAKKSPDWWRQVGAIIVKDGKAILIGHNKPIPSEDYTLNVFGDPRSNFDAGENIELSKVVHAEAGLIAEAARRGIALQGTSLYATVFPCPICAKSIAISGIKRVYYTKGYSLLDAEDVFRAHNIEIVLVKGI